MIIKTSIKNKQFSNTRVAVNNCVEFAQRDTTLEQFLNSKPLNKEIAGQALDHLTESIYDKRSSDYKKYMFRHSIKSALNELVKKNS